MNKRTLQFLLKLPERSSRPHCYQALNCSSAALLSTNIGNLFNKKDKMNFLTIAFCFFMCVYDSSAIDIMPKLKRNIFNFGYGVNFKYEGMLSHSFDRFYVVTKFELPRVEDLKLTTIDLTLTVVIWMAMEIILKSFIDIV